MPKYNGSPKAYDEESKEDVPVKTLIAKNSVLSMTYFDDSDVPVTLNNPNLNNVSIQEMLAEEHKERTANNRHSVGSVGSLSSPRALNGSYRAPYGEANNRNSVGSVSSLQSHEKARSKHESLFEKIKHTPLKNDNDQPGMSTYEMDVEAQTLQHGGFSYYSANESNHNIPVHKNGGIGNKSTVGFADIDRYPSVSFQTRDLSERALPPVPAAHPAANGHGHPLDMCLSTSIVQPPPTTTMALLLLLLPLAHPLHCLLQYLAEL